VKSIGISGPTKGRNERPRETDLPVHQNRSPSLSLGLFFCGFFMAKLLEAINKSPVKEARIEYVTSNRRKVAIYAKEENGRLTFRQLCGRQKERVSKAFSTMEKALAFDGWVPYRS